MYKHELKVHGEYLAEDQALPQNTSADGNGGELRLSDTQGAIELVGVVEDEISLADTKVLTIKLREKDDGGSYADKATLYTKTASGATTLAAGTELFRYILPTDTKDIIKAQLTTTDAAAAGSVTIYPNYLAR